MLYTLARRWPLLAIVGSGMSTFGVGLILQPLVMMKAALLVFGVAALLLGLSVFFIPRRLGEGSDVIMGACLCLIVGMVSLIGAALPVALVADMLAAQSLIAALAQIVIAVDLRAAPLLGAVLVSCSMVSLALGMALLLAPLATLVALLALFGACCCTCGLLLLLFAGWCIYAIAA